MKKKNEELMRQIEGAEYDSRYTPKYITYYRNCKWTNSPVRTQSLSNVLKKLIICSL